jgi:hypothetical protein
MITSARLPRALLLLSALILAAISVNVGAADAGERRGGDARTITAQQEPPMKAGAAGLAARPDGARRGTIEKLTGVWVEGPGFDVSYGGSYEACAQKCLEHKMCVMLEYYRPEKKCNLYKEMRPRKAGGASFVGIRG